MNWKCSIEKCENGFVVIYPKEIEDNIVDVLHVIEESETDKLKEIEDLLFWIIDYFDYYGSKHDPERITVTREKHE